MRPFPGCILPRDCLEQAPSCGEDDDMCCLISDRSYSVLIKADEQEVDCPTHRLHGVNTLSDPELVFLAPQT